MKTYESSPKNTVSSRVPPARNGAFERSDRPGGFTLVEMVIVIALVTTVAAFAIPHYSRTLDAARVARAIGDIKALEKDVSEYKTRHGRIPATLAEINRDNMLDPWKKPYVYLNFVASNAKKGDMRKDRFLVPLNSEYDLYSTGRDGLSKPPLSAPVSRDDIIRANDGGFVGLAVNY